MDSNFLEEMKSLSVDDIELILKDQKEMYSEQEIKLLNEELLRKREIEKEKAKQDFIDNLPKEINCIKCEGKVSPFDETCKYCGSKIDLNKCLNNMQAEASNKNVKTESNIFLYIASFLIPLLGLILGVIYIKKDKDDLGKNFITISIVSIIVSCIIIITNFL